LIPYQLYIKLPGLKFWFSSCKNVDKFACVIDWCFLLLQKMLDEAKTRVQSEIKDLESKCAELRNIMSDMKTQLYAKFGNHINLEAEDD